MNQPPSHRPIAAYVDDLPVNRMHWLAVAVCALGFSFDLLEIGLGNVLAAVFSTPPNVASSSQLSMLLSSVYVGAIAGAPIFGWFADRYGRRLALICVMTWLAATSTGAAFSSDIGLLMAWRCASGLALGAFPPLMIAYLTDLLPRRHRGALIMITIALSTLGPIAGILLVRAVGASMPLGLAGWRWGFIAGACGSALVALLYVLVPESPRWLESRGLSARAVAALRRLGGPGAGLPPGEPVRQESPILSSSDMTLRRWSLVASLYFLCAWSTLAFPLLSGAVLAQKGFRLDDTLLYIALASTGPLFGNLLCAAVVDRVERRVALALCAFALLGCGCVFIVSQQPLWLVASSLTFNLFGSLLISVLNLYGGEVFPTASRARGVAGAWAVNRIGAAMAPLLLLPLLHRFGAAAMFSVIAFSMLSLVGILKFAPPVSARASLA